ncbi:3-dehydroquinate synthase [Buchnera aphidicola]|uniref:3-dehydroquinate synthase n=1 Tax=Buchnera aphidicola TaxID=9 RepID=UPI0022380D0D|nr:3-dehydroquinate synthase [Buchnera aphidicola]MCW5197469.1 3-dehydroquinate synthase [Buchnera aphidicola (Chaitophorus viminalis)]
MLKKFIVNLKKNKYPIIIGYKLFNKDYILKYFKHKKKYIVITNNTLLNLWKKYFYKYLKKSHIFVDIISIPDGENYKSLNEVNNIITRLLTKNYGRDSILIAFGGGVIGDLTGFIASIYQRGIEFIQIPTTLLAQVDASVGGKTGVNHNLGKNMIGSFWQPKYVIIDLFFLFSLPKKEFLSGFSEVIKYAVIFDKKFFSWIENNFNKLKNLDKNTLLYCIYKCCKLKAKIVLLDEKEKNCRALLNLGHTYGHAIESYMNYKNLLHGEAVSMGIVLALETSYIIGILKKNVLHRIIKLLKCFNLPVLPPKNMPALSYILYMKKDKKNILSKIRLVLPSHIGLVKIYNNISQEIIISAIKKTLQRKY